MFTAQTVESLLGEGEEAPILVQESEAGLFGAILTQPSLKQGLKTWGKRAGESATKKMQQMHDMDAFFPRDVKSLSREEKRKALRTLIILKEKRDETIKS